MRVRRRQEKIYDKYEWVTDTGSVHDKASVDKDQFSLIYALYFGKYRKLEVRQTCVSEYTNANAQRHTRVSYNIVSLLEIFRFESYLFDVIDRIASRQSSNFAVTRR